MCIKVLILMNSNSFHQSISIILGHLFEIVMHPIQKIKYTYFELDREKSEILDGTLVGKNEYEIHCIPESALGITKGDVVEAIVIDEEEPAEFITFSRRTGAKLIQIPNESKFKLTPLVLKQLAEWHCELKDSTNGLNIQISPQLDDTLVIELIESCEAEFIFLSPNPFDGNIFIPL